MSPLYIRGGIRLPVVIHVDSRGRIALPKDIREKCGIKPGSHVLVEGCEIVIGGNRLKTILFKASHALRF